MKIAFVYTGEEYLGIEYLSAVLKEHGHQTQLIYDPCLFNDYYFSNYFLSRLFSFQKRVIDEAVKTDTNLVAFSINTPEYRWACRIAASIKKRRDVPIVFGGHHVTCIPEEVIKNSFIDFAIRGEGEYALLELVKHLEGKMAKKEIKNLYYKDNGQIYNNQLRPLIEDLDSLPFPDKELFYSRMKYLLKNYTVMTSRGCPYSCSYCHNSYLKELYHGNGPYVRRRSVRSVIAELKERKKLYKMERIIFQDEIFILDYKWLKEFSVQYKKEIDLPYSCYVYPDMLNAKIITLLCNSGCVSVHMGIENIDEKVRRELLHRFIPQAQIVHALTLLKRNHIHCKGFFLIGLPGQSENDLIELARFCSKYRFGTPLVFWLQNFPKTAIAEMVKKRESKNSANNFKKYGLFSGYMLEGDTFDVSLSRLRFFISLTMLFSEETVEYIIQKKLYRFFPAHHHIFYLKAVKFFVNFVRKFPGRKEKKKRTSEIISVAPIQKYKYFLLKSLNAIFFNFRTTFR